MRLQTIVILALAVLAGLGSSLYLWQRTASDTPSVTTATVLPAPTTLPAFSLETDEGVTVGREFFEGQWDLVFFGFTHCPDICPMTLATLATARRELAASGADVLPRIVLVSVDPERDTPAVLEDYIGNFGDGIAALTGDEARLKVLTDSLGIFFQRAGGEADNYNVDHSAVVLAIDPDARFSALFSAPHRPSNFTNDLPAIMQP